MPKLTDATIRKALNAGVDPIKPYTMLWDADPTGLGLRMRPTGAHSWIFRYRPGGGGRSEPLRTITLGGYPSIDLGMARDAARKLVAKVVDGADPAQDVRRDKSRDKRVMSVVLDEYGKAMRQRKLVNAGQVESVLRRGLSGLLAREVDSLTRADLVDAVSKVEKAGRPGAAAYLRTNARTMLEWCVSRGHVQFNVMAGLRMPKATRAERLAGDDRRQGRALSDGEIKALWSACEDVKPLGGLVRLGLLTAMRRGELASLRWPDVAEGRIIVAAERAKTGTRHEIPLTALVHAVLEAQAKTKSPLVFGSLKAPGEQLSGWSKMVPKLSAAAGVSFTLHDLRRTCRTLMSRLGVAEDVAEMAIGHVRSDLVSRYNKDTMWQARVEAYALVSKHISALLGRPQK